MSLSIRRARGAWLYTLERRRILDFSLDGGRLPFGHSPVFLREPLRRAIARGERRGCPTPELAGLLARLENALPGYSVVPAGALAIWQLFPSHAVLVPASLVHGSDTSRLAAAVAAAGPFVFDETASAFSDRARLFAADFTPDAVLFDGAFGCRFLACPKTLAAAVFPGLPPALPGALEVQRAAAVLGRVSGSRDPFPVIHGLLERFVSRLVHPPCTWQGFFPILAIDGAVRAAALEAGFLLAGDGVVRVSAAHEPGMVDRLARFLNNHGGS